MPSPKTTKGPEYVALGAALRELRRSAGLTQVEAGQRARIRSNFLSQVEGGKRGVTWSTLLALLAAYGASLHDLADAFDTSG
jgi:transcriptional regulator with XRE-family HTH domain